MDVYEWNKAFVWMDGSSWSKAFLFKDVILESVLKCNNFFSSSNLPNLIQLCPKKHNVALSKNYRRQGWHEIPV